MPISLRERYGVAPENLQFWSSALLGIFGAVTLIGSLIVGWIADRKSSRQPAFLFGLLSLTGGIATLAITNHMWMLIFSRVLQGISGSVVFTVGLALVADTVDPNEIGYYMGYALSAMSCGVLLGPFFGSIFFGIGGYFGVIYLMLGVTVIDILLRLFMVEKSDARSQVTVQEADENTGLLLPTKSYQCCETRITTSRWMTLELLSNPRVATAIYGVFVHILIATSFDGVLTIFCQELFQWSPLKISLGFLAIGIPASVFGPFAGSLSDNYGPRWPAFFGCILTAVPVVLLQLVQRNTIAQGYLLFALLSAIGTCESLIICPLAADLFYVVDTLTATGNSAAYAQSYGLFTCAMAAGTLAGPVLGGYLKEEFGWTAMAWGLGILVASGAIPVYLYTGRERRSV